MYKKPLSYADKRGEKTKIKRIGLPNKTLKRNWITSSYHK
jgi:hypothetical protein